MSRPPGPLWRRSSDELEFDRVAFFSDAVYAIAITLIAVGIGAPVVEGLRVPGDRLTDALDRFGHCAIPHCYGERKPSSL